MRTVAFAAVALLLGSQAQAQTIRIAPPIEVARENDPRRFSEPHLAIHPGNPRQLLAAAWHTRIGSTAAEQHQAQRCSTFVSIDGGTTWMRHDFALVDCGDEQVAILPDGQAVFVALAEAPGIRPARGSWLLVYHSSDAGITWDEQPTVINHGHDHAAVVVDTRSAARKGWIYITTHYQWRDGTGHLSSSVLVVRSRDGGRTFDRPVEVAPTPLHNVSEMPVVLSDGTVVASFVDIVDTAPPLTTRRAWVIRSTDGATTFSTASLVADRCGPPPPFQLSALAVDASDGPFRDRLYFSCRDSSGGGVVVTSSSDRGETWNRPGVIVGSAEGGTEARRVMTTAVNNKGVVGVLIVERKPGAGDRCLEQLFAVSFDGGATFTPAQQVSHSACGNSPVDIGAARLFPTYGDYYGVVTSPDGVFRVLWPEMRDGHSALLTTSIHVAPD